MADLTMPQRQTYPAIRGLAEDEVGPLPLDLATELTLLLEPTPGPGAAFELPADSLDPEAVDNQFLLNGVTIGANWSADIGAGMSDDELNLRGKLKITWGVGLVQYVPQEGFITINITENVTES